MKNIAYWVKRIEEDIYEPDKIIINIGHLRKLLNTTHNSDYAVPPSATHKLPSFLSVCCYITENNMATSFESFYYAIKKLGNFA